MLLCFTFSVFPCPCNAKASLADTHDTWFCDGFQARSWNQDELSDVHVRHVRLWERSTMGNSWRTS